MNIKKIVGVALILTILFGAETSFASHAWSTYHWARSSNPVTVNLGDNLSTSWDPYLATASSDWSLSSVLDTKIVTSAGTRNCRAVPGRVEVCNAKYGSNGWLGIASVWVSGSHITQSTVKLNDTYFSRALYNTTAWKNLVMCQEVGHAFGLDHQDENMSNTPLESCMDYSNNPVPNQHPNAHDYSQLEEIYAHLDEFTSSAGSRNLQAQGENEDALGRTVRFARTSRFEKDLGNGHKVFTFVFWVDQGEHHHD